MASLVKKKKGNRLYYYLVESARVDGKPRIVHQAYLGTAEKLAALVQQRTAPVPLSATLRDFGLPGALWLAAKQSACGPFWNPCGPPRVPDQVPLTISCSRPSTASVIPVRRPKSATGTSELSLLRSGVFLPSVLLRKPSGTLSNRCCQRPASPALPPKILSIARSCVYSVCGRSSNWSVVGCWPTIPPTFTPTLPAPTRGTNWHNSAATTNRAATIFA